MESGEVSLVKFCRLLRSFHCDRIPSNLLIRACEPRPTWSSTGEIVQKSPPEGGVPEWLVNFYNANKSLFQDPEMETHNGCVELTLENGVTYFEVTNEGQPDLELDQHTSIAEEAAMAQERIAVVLQAFPSINAEIIGEEIIVRLMEIAKRSVLPLLSSLTDADIEGWLLSKNLEERESHLFSLFEFLYQIVDALGIDHPLLPLSLPRRIFNIVSDDRRNSCIVLWQGIADMFDEFASSGYDALQYRFLSPHIKTDEGSNSMLGYILAMLLSNENMLAESNAPTERLTEALSRWRPLSPTSPSTMEYFAATSFCSQSQLDSIGRPSFDTVDTKALEGLLLSRRNQYKEAAKQLNATIVDIISQYGPTSMQLGIVTAELANCYNFLRQEGLAEGCVRKTLQSRLDPSLSTRRDGIYLRLALADSFIGRARYNEAVPILQNTMNNPDMSATFRMMSALRLAKSRRRMREDAHMAFELDSPLWTGFRLLNHVPEVLILEYVEELACNVSVIHHMELGNSKKTEELMKAVNSLLGNPSSSVTVSASWEWYTKIQRQYLGEMAKRTKPTKGKGKDERILHGEDDDMDTPASSQAAPHLPLRRDVDISDDEGPWSERLVLSFDGGGVRALSSLLVLKRIMHRIRELEIDHPDGPAYSSSSYPWMGHRNDIPSGSVESDRVDHFLPCHYFDYMAGISTGSLSSIMLGRLRMSADMAIDNFIDFGHCVFGQPRVLQEMSEFAIPLAMYSAAKTRKALEGIIRCSDLFLNEYLSEPLDTDSLAACKTFRYRNDRTRTMAISWCIQNNTGGPYIWRSYDSFSPNFDDRMSLNNSATIRQVAHATSAAPRHLMPIQIGGRKFFDGRLVASNPSFLALQEIVGLHSKTPALFVSLGTGQQGVAGNDARRRWIFQTYPWLLKTVDKGQTTDAETETKQWLGFAKVIGLVQAYRLNVKGDLSKIASDDWHPAGTGKTTLQEIENATAAYLDTDAVRDMIDRIAKVAVRMRRARAETERWEAFAIDLDYNCPLCPDSQRYEFRADLRAHLERSHADRDMSDKEVHMALEKGRRHLVKRVVAGQIR